MLTVAFTKHCHDVATTGRMLFEGCAHRVQIRAGVRCGLPRALGIEGLMG